jgi:hypothetical protein
VNGLPPKDTSSYLGSRERRQFGGGAEAMKHYAFFAYFTRFSTCFERPAVSNNFPWRAKFF